MGTKNGLAEMISEINDSLKICMGIGPQCADPAGNVEVECNITAGKLPRVFHLETTNRALGQKLIVLIGQCPSGGGTTDEVEALKATTPEEALLKLDNIFPIQAHQDNYGNPIMELLSRAGLKGPILWTEYQKCENREDSEPLTDSCANRCADLHLREELLYCASVDAIVVAVGSDAFDRSRKLMSGSRIIGVPHPSRRNADYNLVKALQNQAFVESFKQAVALTSLHSRLWITKDGVDRKSFKIVERKEL
jgi:hypothetical protein